MADENVEKNLEALDEEKEEYLEEHPGEADENSDEEMEEVDVEETEFSLAEDEIDEWINELTRLKEEKGSITLSVDDETDLKINYEESSEEHNSEDEDESAESEE